MYMCVWNINDKNFFKVDFIIDESFVDRKKTLFVQTKCLMG